MEAKGNGLIDKMSEANNEGNEDEIATSRETRFINESTYDGTWDGIDKIGIGRYLTPYGAMIEGEHRDGTFHGCGSIIWPRAQTMVCVWNRGEIEQKRYTFADGLSYEENDWRYCTSPDRRFYNCIVNGLRPAGKILQTDDQPTKIIPPHCYDTGAGIFDPNTNCVTSYSNSKKVLKIPTKTESTWIKKHCRKDWSEPTGHRTWLHEYWRSGTADFAFLPNTSPEDETENWWQRLTKFTRHTSVGETNKM